MLLQKISIFAYCEVVTKKRERKFFVVSFSSHSLCLFSRLWWRSPIACTTLSESRRSESFADLQARMESTPTLPASSSSLKALCGLSFRLASHLVSPYFTIEIWRQILSSGNKYRIEVLCESNLRLMCYSNVRSFYHQSWKRWVNMYER